MQSMVFPHINAPINVVVEAKTSSGKTIAAELIAGKSLCEDRKVIYLSPLKALAEEKLDDWKQESHPWYPCKKTIFTGDYRLTEARIQEANEADILICTYEMLAVRCRNHKSERSAWLTSASTLIVDEGHFIGSENRGSHLETALLTFTQINPSCRIVFLSATLINSKLVTEWVTALNGHPTVLIQSDYRPCKLAIHYAIFRPTDGSVWQTRAQNKKLAFNRLRDEIQRHPKDQWLIFCHTKGDVAMLKENLAKDWGKAVSYHNADLSKSERAATEQAFKSGKIRVLIATSTLAYGLNLPARRVAIFGVDRGMDEVDPLDVIQECGRAGRPKYDKEGDAYLVIDQERSARWQKYLENGIAVTSQLHNHRGFHAIGEIAEKRANDVKTLAAWYDRSFAKCQGLSFNVPELIECFKSYGLVDTHEDRFVATKLGVIASKNYFDPFDVTHWQRNYRTLHERALHKGAAPIAWAISNIPSNNGGYIPKDFKGEAAAYLTQLQAVNLRAMSSGATAMGAMLYLVLMGEENRCKPMFSRAIGFRTDIQRLMSCLQQIDQRVNNHNEPSYWKQLCYRFVYGVGWKQAELCAIPGIGKKYSQILLDFGIDTAQKFYQNAERLKTILPEHLYAKAFAKVPC